MKFILPNTTPLVLSAFRLLSAGILILAVAVVLKLPQPKTIWSTSERPLAAPSPP